MTDFKQRLYGEDADLAGLHAAADAAVERDVTTITPGAQACAGCNCPRHRCQPLWRDGRKCCPDCHHQPTYPLNLKPWELEPHYSKHVADMTAEALHDKSDIALQLAWRDKKLADLQRIISECIPALRRGIDEFDDGTDPPVYETASAAIERLQAASAGIVEDAKDKRIAELAAENLKLIEERAEVRRVLESLQRRYDQLFHGTQSFLDD